MAIRINDNNFYLETENTAYQIQVDRYDVLQHIWYGEKTNQNMDYLLDYHDTGFSGCIYDAGNERSYSVDTLPQEYPASGNGDFRIGALSVRHADGSRALDLRYKSSRVLEGKYAIPGLPAVYDENGNAETLEIVMCDKVSGIEVVLQYAVIPDCDVITRCAVIKNNGTKPAELLNAGSLCLDIPNGEWEWIHFHGRHTLERCAERKPLLHGIQTSSSSRGTSSHQQNPSVILCSPECTETSGKCVGAALVYSGGFETNIEVDQLNQTRLIMGIDTNTFCWRLAPGEVFYTPEAILSYSSGGLEKLSHNFHHIIRNNICRGKFKASKRPVLINNWEATYFDFDENSLFNIAEKAAQLGVELFVMDDGWFGNRNSDCSGLGDWSVNTEKLKNGLVGLTSKIKQLGMDFGIWMEPEMVSEDSNLYRTHPDWAIKIPNRDPIRSRYQLVLDMSRKDVVDYLFDAISKILSSADISYIKWDMNRSITNWYSAELSHERQGEAAHRYVLGLYDLLERITSAFPDILIEGCSGGGGRFDAGMLYYCPQIWCSDNTDAYDRTKIQYGTSFFYPVSAVGSHVSVVPNHQTGRITPIESRAVTAMAGSFGYELDLNQIDDKEKHAVRNQIERYKQYQKLIYNGTYYRLSNPFEDNYALWEFVSEDKSEVLVHGMIFRTDSNANRSCIQLRGLDRNKYYNMDGKIYGGAALEDGGILLPQPAGDYYPIELYIREN